MYDRRVEQSRAMLLGRVPKNQHSSMPTMLQVDGFRVFLYSAEWGAVRTAAVGLRTSHLATGGAEWALRSLSAILAPLEWFPRLRDGTVAQRANWRPIGGGVRIHWPELDEDLSVAGLLATH